MVDTGYNVSPETGRTRYAIAPLTKKGNSWLTNSSAHQRTGNTVYGGTYGLFSTTEDYSKFCQIFLKRGLMGIKF